MVVRGVVAELGRVVESSLNLDLRWAITDRRILNRHQPPQIVDFQEITDPSGLLSSTGRAHADRRPLSGVGSPAHREGDMGCHHRSD
jgi:hypothetical protein